MYFKSNYLFWRSLIEVALVSAFEEPVDRLIVARLLISVIEFLISVRSRFRASAFISDEFIMNFDEEEACDEVCELDVICV